MAQNEIIVTRGAEGFWIATRNGTPTRIAADTLFNAVLKLQQKFPNDRVGIHVSVFESTLLEQFASVVWIKKIEIKPRPN